MAKLVNELYCNAEVPVPMAAMVVIAALSGGISPIVDVELHKGSASPTMVYTWVVGSTGSRKSFIERMVRKVFVFFQKEAMALMKSQLSACEARIIAWHCDVERIERRLRTEEDPNTRFELESNLEALLSTKPKRLYYPKFLTKDTTPEGLIKSLSRWSSCLISAAEGGTLLNGRAMTNQTLFNELWDGDDQVVDRATEESFVVENPRVTVSILVQAQIFREFLEKNNNGAIDNGFMSRFLMCYPESLEGNRFNVYATGSWEHLEAFHVRIREILLTLLPTDGVLPPRILLKLSQEARVALRDFTNRVEADLAPGRYLSDVKGNANKAGEIAVRLAALFHHFEGFEGDIGPETMQGALEMVSWHLEEAKRLLAKPPEVPMEVLDAIQVEDTIRRHLELWPGKSYVYKSYLFSHTKKPIRTKQRLDMALHILTVQCKIELNYYGNKIVIVANPFYFPSVNQQPGLNYYPAMVPNLQLHGPL